MALFFALVASCSASSPRTCPKFGQQSSAFAISGFARPPLLCPPWFTESNARRLYPEFTLSRRCRPPPARLAPVTPAGPLFPAPVRPAPFRVAAVAQPSQHSRGRVLCVDYRPPEPPGFTNASNVASPHSSPRPLTPWVIIAASPPRVTTRSKAAEIRDATQQALRTKVGFVSGQVAAHNQLDECPSANEESSLFVGIPIVIPSPSSISISPRCLSCPFQLSLCSNLYQSKSSGLGRPAVYLPELFPRAIDALNEDAHLLCIGHCFV